MPHSLLEPIHYGSCDNCGNPILDKDEIFCRTCKPILAHRAEYKKCLAEIDALYWQFCRCANAKPPVVANPEVHRRRNELEEILGVRS